MIFSSLEKMIEAQLTQGHVNHLLMLLPLLLQLLGLLFAVAVDSYISKKHRTVMLIITALALALVVQNYTEYHLAEGELRWLPRTLTAICGYVLRPVILVMFFYIVSPNRRYLPAWILIGINAAVHMTALFSTVCFQITENNSFHRGPLGNICRDIGLLLLAYLVYMTAREFSQIGVWERFIPLVNAVLILFGLILDGSVGAKDQPVTFLTDTIVSSSVFYYIWLHLQFVRGREKEAADGQRAQLMLSQIRPHFLYNSLGAIEEVCDSDPQAAKRATVTFSRYLRGNMDSVSASGAIPFEKELSHTQFYLELEQLRFEDALQVEYDIDVTDFTIPTLTLEPLAENAVRHGVRGNADGRGTVIISTREFPDHYEVSVADDGPGFDPDVPPDDGRSHVGLQNVKKRLLQVSGGTLRIFTAPGAGTTATIVLPRRGNTSEYISEG